MRSTPLAALLAVVLTACATGAPAPAAPRPPPAPAAARYTLPGERVFPEGIACDHATGDLYVGSTADGTIFRGNVATPGEFEVFLPPGQDGREAVTGVKVDPEGRLWAAGRRTGRAFVYDTRSGGLIKAFSTAAEGERTLVNDLTFAGPAAYLTDSFRPVVFRVARGADRVGELEPWLDLTGTPIPTVGGFNLNGIAGSDDGRYLVTIHYDSGNLYRIDTRTRAVTQVNLGGVTLPGGDGLLLDGQALFAVSNGAIMPVAMSPDLSTGRVGAPITDPSFAYPTTVAQCGTDRLQVVNSQLDREGGVPQLPFTVSDIPVDIP